MDTHDDAASGTPTGVGDAPGRGQSTGEGGDVGAPALPALPRRLLDVFFSPGTLFAALRHEPRWVGALLLGTALSMLTTALIPTELFVEMMRQGMLESGRPVPEGFDPGSFGTMQKVFGVVGGGISWLVIAFLLAGLTSLVFAFLLGDEGGYKRHLAVVSHALLILAVGGLITVPLKLVQGDLQVSLNLGLFFPLEEGWAQRFLRGLDLFWLWTFVVVGVGVHELDRRRSVGVAVAILLAVPLALSAAVAAFTG